MSWWAAAVLSLSTTVLLILALRPFAKAVGLVDRPGGRKAHIGEVPVIGGLAMFSGFVLGIALVPSLPGQMVGLPIAAALLVLIGVLDDRFSLPTATRLLAQVVAVLIMIYGAGLIMRDIGNPLWIGTIGTGPLAVPLTVLMTLTVVNAFNTIDGIDGLAGSIALIALLGIAVLANGSPTAIIAALAASCVIGYLIFNLPISLNRRVHSFMGDAGSTMLGFVIVWLTISICQGNERLISPVVGLWLVALPLFDLFTCVVRRALRGRSPMIGGRDHIHHTLKRGGFSGPEILLVLLLLNGSYVLIGMAGHLLSVHESLLFLLWAIVGMSQYAIVKKICTIRRAHARRHFARA